MAGQALRRAGGRAARADLRGQWGRGQHGCASGQQGARGRGSGHHVQHQEHRLRPEVRGTPVWEEEEEEACLHSLRVE